MIWSIFATIGLLGAVLWLPVGVQIALFVLVVLVFPYRLMVLIPAIVADVVYAPSSTFAINHLIMTGIVAGMLAIWYVIVHKTRLGEPSLHTYVSIKK
jgi:hypothetical protein